jgi:hypothetical protein
MITRRWERKPFEDAGFFQRLSKDGDVACTQKTFLPRRLRCDLSGFQSRVVVVDFNQIPE